MVFDIYKIRSAHLSKYVQYVLFNYSDRPECSHVVTSFANTNICLGIVKEQELCSREDEVKYMRPKPGVHSYISAMYMEPHRFEASGMMDEICIDFSPSGYYRFFRIPVKTYMLHDDVLTEGFGKGAREFFEQVFCVSGFQQRGAMIEQFLLEHLAVPDTTFLDSCLYEIHQHAGSITLRDLAESQRCSEKKIVRAFISNFDLTPKDYMRIVRFRKVLALLNSTCTQSLTAIGYDASFSDQSHFIKDFRFFTGKTPKQISRSLTDVKQNVIIGVE